MSSDRTVAALGESGLIARVRARLRAPEGELWSGDDAALVAIDGTDLLLTTDVLVEGVDFERSWAAGFDVGSKAIAVNVSDIAAMGGTPLRAVATLCVPGDTPAEWIESLLDGLAEEAGRFDIGLVGGDVSAASEISVAVMLIGIPGPRVVTRAGARPGDEVLVTGALGGAAVGLHALRAGLDGHEQAKKRQLRPKPRLEEGRSLASSGATAMIDVSDGLARDLDHLLVASGVGCSLDPDAIPIDEGVEIDGGPDPLTAALAGGEDFELLCTVPPDRVDDVTSSLAVLGTRLTRIGTITDGAALIGSEPLEQWKEKGWEHLRTR